MQLLDRHLPQIVIGILRHEAQALAFGAQPPHLARRLGDGFQLGIFLRHRDEAVAGQVAGRHLRRQLVAPRLDLGDAFGGDGHALSDTCQSPPRHSPIISSSTELPSTSPSVTPAE